MTLIKINGTLRLSALFFDVHVACKDIPYSQQFLGRQAVSLELD